MFLWPVGGKKVIKPAATPVKTVATVELATNRRPQHTTAEAMRQELADAQAKAPAVALSTFAPDNLLPGQGLSSRNRKAGASMGRYRRMAEDLFPQLSHNQSQLAMPGGDVDGGLSICRVIFE